MMASVSCLLILSFSILRLKSLQVGVKQMRQAKVAARQLLMPSHPNYRQAIYIWFNSDRVSLQKCVATDQLMIQWSLSVWMGAYLVKEQPHIYNSLKMLYKRSGSISEDQKMSLLPYFLAYPSSNTVKHFLCCSLRTNSLPLALMTAVVPDSSVVSTADSGSSLASASLLTPLFCIAASSFSMFLRIERLGSSELPKTLRNALGFYFCSINFLLTCFQYVMPQNYECSTKFS